MSYTKENNNYKIFSYDDKGNLLLGHLEVIDYDMLYRLRNILLQNRKVCFKRTRKDTFDSYFINTILIFNSLLNNLDENKCGTVAKKLVANGTIKLMSLSDVWNICVNELINSMNSDNEDIHKDYELFSEVLNNGNFIKYVVDEVIDVANIENLEELNRVNAVIEDSNHLFGEFLKYDVEFFKQVKNNSLLFGTCKIKRRIKS